MGTLSCAQKPAPPLLTRSALSLPVKSPSLVIQKRQRLLLLYSGTRLVFRCRIGLGLDPIEVKQREGDRCTPEGRYHITGKNANSHFYQSLALSYPNRADAERGLREHRIRPVDYARIVKALRQHRAPPQDTPLGGKILIHGGGSSRDWTWGCVALDNAEMHEVFQAVPVGTPVRIEH